MKRSQNRQNKRDRRAQKKAMRRDAWIKRADLSAVRTFLLSALLSYYPHSALLLLLLLLYGSLCSHYLVGWLRCRPTCLTKTDVAVFLGGGATEVSHGINFI